MAGPGASSSLLLGSALPDLAGMARFRLLGTTANDAVTSGIELHHATDHAFHQHRWFTERQAGLRATLEAAGVERGPARAVAHVGPELLLDRWVLATSGGTVHRALGAAELLREQLTELVVPDRTADWLRHLDRVAQWRPTTADHEPEQVTDRLIRMLARRPRLAMATTDRDIVLRALRDIDADLQSTAAEFVAELADTLVEPRWER